MKIMVNCGHGRLNAGGWDSGCVYGKYTEAGLMLPITKSAVKHLREQGITVLSDADMNNNKNMVADVDWANKEKVSIYVSIHCDYSGAPSGVMPLYVSSAGKKLATCLNTAIVKGMGMKSRGAQRRTDLYELNATDMPACILETGGIKADLSTLEKAEKYGECVARGICSYLGVTYKEKTVYGKMIKYTAKRVVNVYSDHSTSSKKVGKLKKGSIYTATKWYRDDWCYIPYVKGWVPIKGSKGTYLEKAKIMYTIVNPSGVNVYADHTTKSKCLGNVKRGSTITATQWYGAWAYIPSQEGWVAVSCLHQGDRAQALLYECAEIAKTLKKYNFRYSTSNLKYTLSAAVKSDHRIDCAHYVSFAMQALNILPSGKYIWLNRHINGNGASYIKKSNLVTITYPNKLPSKCNLKPGDICGWGYTVNGVEGQHTMVYAGKDAKGNYLWYTGGTSDVNNESYGPKQKPTYMKRNLNVLIRLK